MRGNYGSANSRGCMKPDRKKVERTVNIKIDLPQEQRGQYLHNPKGCVSFRNLPTSTRIKELCNKLCDNLNVDLFTTNIQITKQWENRPLNWCSTIKQCNIKSGDLLIAKGTFFTNRGIKQQSFSKIINPHEAYKY